MIHPDAPVRKEVNGDPEVEESGGVRVPKPERVWKQMGSQSSEEAGREDDERCDGSLLLQGKKKSGPSSSTVGTVMTYVNNVLLCLHTVPLSYRPPSKRFFQITKTQQ